MTALSPDPASTYTNPVYRQTFADPFVLKYRGQYWAYCTGIQPDGKAFGVLHSYDLVHWKAAGGAMTALPGEHPCYWAPEVTYDNGRFYLYYSVGNEETMHIRVAIAVSPAGPFVDSGKRLTAEPFAIDPHLFRDDDGRRYLFYATDFYDHTHVGTGTVRDRLLDPFTLAGQAQPVSRPRYDWQVYDPQRAEKGGVRWHTIEGPFVLKRKGTYYQMFSGGNWQNPSYGVAYALSEDVEARGEWLQVCDGERVPPILQTAPGRVIGPGHNSVVRAPNNMQQICVYHRWAGGEGRQMAIDELDWAGERLLVLGPSDGPSPAPLPPHFAGFLPGLDREAPEEAWQQRGSAWVVRDGAATPQESVDAAELRYAPEAPAFIVEVSVAGPSEAAYGAWGLLLYGGETPLLSALLAPRAGAAVVGQLRAAEWREQRCALPEAFDFAAYHLLRLEVDGARACLSLDEAKLWQGTLGAEITALALRSEEARAAFSGFALTYGWQTLFVTEGEPQREGWPTGGAPWHISEQQLTYAGAGASRICRGPRFNAYELAVNARLDGEARPGACYGFLPALDGEDEGPLLTVEGGDGGWRLVWQSDGETTIAPLPAAFDATATQQFRFRKQGTLLAVSWEGRVIASGTVSAGPARVGLYGRAGAVFFDMVRLSAL